MALITDGITSAKLLPQKFSRLFHLSGIIIFQFTKERPLRETQSGLFL
jgi:hypothetical protein